MSMEPRPHYTRELFRLFSNHRRAIILITAGTTLLALGISVLWLIASPNYRASATLTTLPSRQEIQLASSRSPRPGTTPAQLMSQTHTEFLLSETLAERVVDDLMAARESENAHEMDTGPGWVKSLTDGVRRSAYAVRAFLNYGRVEKIEQRDALVAKLRASTRVHNVPGSYVLKVTVTWDDPELAAAAANQVCSAYADRLQREQDQLLESASRYLSEKMIETKVSLGDIDHRIEIFKSETGVYSGSHDLELKMNELSETLSDFNETKVRIDELETKINLLKSYQTPSELAEIQAQREGVMARKTALDDVIKSQMKDLERFPAHETQWLTLVRDKLDQEKILDGLRERMLDLKVMEGTEIPLVQTIDPAKPPTYPSSPKVLANSAVGGILGMILSCGYAVGLNVLRNDVRTPELLKQFNAPMAGVVPFDTHHREWDGRLPMNADSDLGGASSSEPVINTHVEHLMHHLTGSGEKVVMVSSTMANVGKSYLLKRLAEQAILADKRVLALDLDRREPSLHESFGVPPKISLASVAMNQARLRDAIVRISSHLDYAGSTGKETSYGSSRWQIDRIRNALDAIRDDYDLILVDSAAMRRDPLVAQLWSVADRILVVVNSMETSVPEVEEFLQRSAIDREKIAMVLNKVRYKPDFLFEA